MEHGADHIESDSPSEHGNKTPRPRASSPSVSLTSRAHYYHPNQASQTF